MKIDIARAWKDSEYRKSLTPEQLASLPPNPVEAGEMADGELDGVSGGRRMTTVTLGGPTRCGTAYPECCYNSTVGPQSFSR